MFGADLPCSNPPPLGEGDHEVVEGAGTGPNPAAFPAFPAKADAGQTDG